MEQILPYLIGAALLWLLHRFGVSIPGMAPPPDPALKPAPPGAPAASAAHPLISVPGGLNDVLQWLLQVRAGTVLQDDRTREAIRLVRAALPPADDREPAK